MPEQVWLVEKTGRGLAKRGLWRAIIAGNDLHCQAAARGFAVLGVISLPVSYMVSITLSRQTRGCWYGAAPYARRSPLLLPQWRTLDARYLHLSSNRVTRQTEVCSMAISAAMHTCAGLAPNSLPDQPPPLSTPRQLHPGNPLGTRNRRVHLIKRTNGAGYQQ